jgi:hypothetical protein
VAKARLDPDSRPQVEGQQVSVHRTWLGWRYSGAVGHARRRPGYSQAYSCDRQRPRAHTDRQALNQLHAAAVPGWPRPDGTGEPRFDPRSHLPVNLCDECSYYRVAVLRPKLGVHFSRGADVFWRHRRRTHGGRITLAGSAHRHPGRNLCLVVALGRDERLRISLSLGDMN